MKHNYFGISSIVMMILFAGSTFVDAYAQTHISTAAELQAIKDNPSGSYILDNDIDLENFTWDSFDFSGTLNGNGYSISNLFIDENDHIGLFNNISNATISNLGLKDVAIYGSWIGAIAGHAESSTIERCFATGELESTNIAGGLIGHMVNTSISQCYTQVSVTGSDHVGGIAGHMEGGSVQNCYTNSDVYSTGYQVGGIAGWAQNAGTSITKCYAKGTVSSESGFTGGILGIADGSEKVVDITECLALQTSITTVNPDIEKTYRIIANHAAATYSTNFGLETIILSDPHKTEWENDIDGKDGRSITSAQAVSSQFYADSLTWDFENVWYLDTDGPVLKWTITTGVSDVFSINANIYVKNGLINVESEPDTEVLFYNLNGVLLKQAVTKNSVESFNINEKVLIVKLTNKTGTGVYKIMN